MTSNDRPRFSLERAGNFPRSSCRICKKFSLAA
jgi:hypothetical protein